MSETNTSPKSKEQDKTPQKNGLQFKDGRIGIGVVEPGSVFKFNVKYTDPKDIPTTILVKTASGSRYALGQGVMVELPELDPATGKFGKQDDKVKAIRVGNIPAGVSDIVIGEAWPTLGSEDPISLAMYDYKASPPDAQYYKVDTPNPFDSARDHLTRVRESMELQGV